LVPFIAKPQFKKKTQYLWRRFSFWRIVKTIIKIKITQSWSNYGSTFNHWCKKTVDV